MEVKRLGKNDMNLLMLQDEISLHEHLHDLLLYARVDLIVDQVECFFNHAGKDTCTTYSQIIEYIKQGMIDDSMKKLVSHTFSYPKMLSAFKENHCLFSQAFQYRQEDGKFIWVMLRARLIQDPATNIVCAFLYLLNIDDRKKAANKFDRQLIMDQQGRYQMASIKQLCEFKQEACAMLFYLNLASLPKEVHTAEVHRFTMLFHEGFVGMNEQVDLFVFFASPNEEIIHTRLTNYLIGLEKYHVEKGVHAGGVLYHDLDTFERIQEYALQGLKEAIQRDLPVVMKHITKMQNTLDNIEDPRLFDMDMLKKELQNIDYTITTSASVIAGEYHQDQQAVLTVLRECNPTGWIYLLDGNIFVVITSNIEEALFIENEQNLKQKLNEEGKLYSSYAKENPNIEQIVDRLITILQMTHTLESTSDKEKYHTLLAEIESKRYMVYIQPKATIENGAICGGEALIRYHTKHGDIQTPDEFIPGMEANGSIQYLDLFVFGQVCQILQDWKDKGYELFPISLNFSRITLLSSDLLMKMNKIQNKYTFSRNLIEIEITERVGEIEQYVMKKITDDISSCGYRLSLDDFGAEYSNVAILSNVAFDTLKIDKEIIHNIHNNYKMQIIITNLSDLCHKLQIETVAEGVDSVEKLDVLRDIGVDVMQGYLVNKPIPILEFEKAYLKSETTEYSSEQECAVLVQG